jgi:hypothetical protein
VHEHVHLHLLWLLQWLPERQLLLEPEQRHLRRRRPRIAVLVLRSRHRLQRLRRRPANCIPASIAAGPSTIAAVASAAVAAAPPSTIAAIASADAAPAPIAATASAAAQPLPKIPAAKLVAEPAKAAPDSTPSAKAAAFAAFAAFATKFAAISLPSAAAVPLPTGRGWPVHEHVLCLLLQWVLRTLHVLRCPKC